MESNTPKEPAEPGSIDELIEIADLLHDAWYKRAGNSEPVPTVFELMQLAAQVRRNDLLSEINDCLSAVDSTLQED